MTDEIKLTIETLRYCEESGARCGECPSGADEKGIPHCHSQAHIANLIESLAAELEQVKQERDGLSIMLTSATSAAETYKRERDAAVKDIYSMKACALCKHYPSGEECETYFLLCVECDKENCICKGCVNGERLEWRGAKEG